MYRYHSIKIPRIDGDVVNHDNSYGASSDERIKQDIVDAISAMGDDIKAIKGASEIIKTKMMLHNMVKKQNTDW